MCFPIDVKRIVNNTRCISLGMKVRKISKVQTGKVTFKVIQCHRLWCHSIGHIRFPISLPLQLCLYLAPLPRYYHTYCPKFKDITWPRTHRLKHALTSIVMYQIVTLTANHGHRNVSTSGTARAGKRAQQARGSRRQRRLRGGVWGVAPPPQPTRGSGGASWAPPAESGAEPRPPMHF